MARKGKKERIQSASEKRAAIIGFGGMGQRHYHAYVRSGVEVVAIADWNAEKISQVLPDLPREHIYGSDRALLANEEIDILSVVTNGPTHAEVAIRAAEHGVPLILCEKPIATNLRDAQRVIDASERYNTRLAVNHIRRWSSTYRQLKNLIGDGIIGDIRHFYLSMGSSGIGNFPIHFFDTARYLTGSEPEWAVGFLDRTGTPNPRGQQFMDPGGYGILQFRDGVRFFFDSSEDTGVQYFFQIVGTYGRITIDELNDIWGIRARGYDARGIPLTRYGTEMPIIPFERDSPHDIVQLTSCAISNLITGESVSCTGEDGRRALEMVVALHVSDDRDHERIYFPLDLEYATRDVRIA